MAEVPKETTETNNVASSHNDGEENKEVLAPSDGPREDLIQTAVKFLQNPRVRTSPLAQKKTFLEKKGLTQEEIKLAIERSGVVEGSSQSLQLHSDASNANRTMSPPPNFPPPSMQVNYPPPIPIPPQSRWAQARDLTLTSVIMAGVSFAVYQVFQTYLRPLIWGKSEHEKRIENLESQVELIHRSVSDSLADISRTLQAIQASINVQQTQPTASQFDGKAVGDLKSDIASLKGLLLSRNQFPPAPLSSPMLPSWQRPNTSPLSLNSNLVDQVTPVSGQDSSKPIADVVQNGDQSNQINNQTNDFSDMPETSFTADADSVDGPAMDTTVVAGNTNNLDFQD